jgi:hypothetical protein
MVQKTKKYTVLSGFIPFSAVKIAVLSRFISVFENPRQLEHVNNNGFAAISVSMYRLYPTKKFKNKNGNSKLIRNYGKPKTVKENENLFTVRAFALI